MPLITNATAPVDTITITVDNRYTPPDIKFASSRPLPGPWVVKVLIFCVSGLMDMMMQAAPQPMPAENGKPPDLPPAS